MQPTITYMFFGDFGGSRQVVLIKVKNFMTSIKRKLPHNMNLQLEKLTMNCSSMRKIHKAPYIMFL